MSNNMRIIKFETLIKDINEAFNNRGILGLMPCKEYSNISLLLIFEYDQLNDYGKAIIEQSSLHSNYGIFRFESDACLNDWHNKYSTADCLKDSKTKIDAAKEFVRYCRMEENRKAAYKFIFWAMMVLTVDKTDKEEKLSLICDFARMLKISDDEMMDILQVIKVLYHKEQEGIEFKSQTVPSYFSSVVGLYN